MATNEVGSLLVKLGIDTAQFQDGLRRAESGLDKFSKLSAVTLAAVSAAAVTAAGALSVMVKGSIDAADEMGDLAEKAGVSSEALSRLGYAATFSATNVETVATSFQRLSAQMAMVAQGTGEQARIAFEALGIQVTNADGTLRAADAVFIDIADRFSRMADGADKTAIAVQLFGRAGAELIPLLNQGREGLAAMADEADRLGITISSDFSRDAGRFNDAIDKVNKALGGIVNQIAEEAVPALADLAEAMTGDEFESAVRDVAQFGVQILREVALIVGGIASAINYVKGIGESLGIGQEGRGIGGALAAGMFGDEFIEGGGVLGWIRRMNAALDEAIEKQENFRRINGFGAGLSFPSGLADAGTNGIGAGASWGGLRSMLGLPNTENGPVDPAGLGASWEEFAEIFRQTADSVGGSSEDMGNWLADLSDSFAGAMEAAREAAERIAEAWAYGKDLLTGTLDDLSKALAAGGEKNLGISKALATASAVVDGWSAVQAAWAQGWKIGPLAAAAYAGLAMTRSVANIAAIWAVNSSTRSMSGGGAGAPVAAAAPVAPTHVANITLQGGMYSDDQIRALFERLGEWQGDGPGGMQFLVTAGR